MKRRLFLKGVAGASLAAPFLASLQSTAKAQSTAPKRLVIFYTNNGCLTNRWFPSVENGALDASALAGKTLEPLSDLAHKLLVPRGLAMFPAGFNVTVNGIKYFDPHDQGMGSKLTCGPIDPTEGSKHYALQRSLDHEVAEIFNPIAKTPLVLSVGYSSSDVKQVVSYKAAGEPYVAETRASNVYSTLSGLFGTGSGEPTEADYRVKQGKSIIDLVSNDLATFQRLPMSMADQKKVTDWLELVRETEVGVVSAQCNEDAVTQLGITDEELSSGGGRPPGGGGGGNEATFVKGGDTMIKLIALTMMCDANRTILLQWPGYAVFDFLGLTTEHHGLSHRVGSAATSGPCIDGVIEMIGQIDTWYAGRYSQLVHLIDSVGEGEGTTMLDNSAVMWLPELADGNAHNNNNLPIVIAGSMGGYLKQGQAVNVDGKMLGTGDSEAACKNPGDEVSFITGSNTGNKVPLNKLYVTLMNGMGPNPAGGKFTQFGTADTNNVDDGITNPGELTDLVAAV
jgi:hypothetical protein